MKENIIQLIRKPKFCSKYLQKEGAILTKAEYGSYIVGSVLYLELLFDEENYKIIDASYLFFGPPEGFIILEIILDFLIGKKHAQANNIAEKSIRNIIYAKSKEFIYSDFIINILIDCLKSCCSMFVPKNIEYVTPIILEKQKNHILNWDSKTDEEKFSIVSNIIKSKIIPFTEIDGGSIRINRLSDGIAYLEYEGTCKGCPSAYGSTLESIKYIIKANTSESLNIIISN